MRNVLEIISTLFVVIFKLGNHLPTCFATADISCKVGKELGIFNTWMLSASLLHSVIINNNNYYYNSITMLIFFTFPSSSKSNMKS